MQTPPKERELKYWTINFNGFQQLQGAGAGILLTSPKGESLKYVLQMHFLASNNATEYEALLNGLKITTALGIHVDVSYAAPQAHEIVNVALHWEYSSSIVFIFS
jgi:hypothetical protein